MRKGAYLAAAESVKVFLLRGGASQVPIQIRTDLISLFAPPYTESCHFFLPFFRLLAPPPPFWVRKESENIFQTSTTPFFSFFYIIFNISNANTEFDGISKKITIFRSKWDFPKLWGALSLQRTWTYTLQGETEFTKRDFYWVKNRFKSKISMIQLIIYEVFFFLYR